METGGEAGERKRPATVGVGQRIDLLAPEIAADIELMFGARHDYAVVDGGGLIAGERGVAVG